MKRRNSKERNSFEGVEENEFEECEEPHKITESTRDNITFDSCFKSLFNDRRTNRFELKEVRYLKKKTYDLDFENYLLSQENAMKQKITKMNDSIKDFSNLARISRDKNWLSEQESLRLVRLMDVKELFENGELIEVDLEKMGSKRKELVRDLCEKRKWLE